MKKIMIIDDELDILDVLDRFLSRKKLYDIETFSNPESAIKCAKSGEYDLILSDIMMPQVSGLEILEEIKTTNPKVKVVFMTAYSNKDKVNKSESLGVDGYLEKPFRNLSIVEKTISELLN